MQIHNAISGQYFTLKIIREDGKFTTMILSNVDETRSHAVSIEKRELKELADFIYKQIGTKNE
jgi:hypothetical protein